MDRRERTNLDAFPVRNRSTERQKRHMETVHSYRLSHLFIEALCIEWKILKMLGQTIARATVFVFVQLMYVVREAAALVVDALCLLLGIEVRTVVGVNRTDNA